MSSLTPLDPAQSLQEIPIASWCSLPSKSAQKQHFIGCSIKTRAVEHFGESNNLSTYLKALADSIWDASAEQIKKYPWKKASSIVAEQLLILGQKGLKWSLVLLFAFSFLFDVIMAVSRNRELIIPFGLFTDVILADVLKESSQEFFHRTIKEERIPVQLLGIPVQLLGAGSFFCVHQVFIIVPQSSMEDASIPFWQWWVDASLVVSSRNSADC